MGIALLVAPVPASADVVPLTGSLHEHSGYSDGWPGSRPQTYYDSGRAFGLDFMSGSEHSDNADLPIVASEECISPLVAPDCALADKVNPLDWASSTTATPSR